jgi:hypothetical protein
MHTVLNLGPAFDHVLDGLLRRLMLWQQQAWDTSTATY